MLNKDKMKFRNHKVGYLKYDLYKCNHNGKIDLHTPYSDWLWSPYEKFKFLKNEIRRLEDSLELISPKGTRFVCEIIDRREYWRDDLNVLKDMNAKWAKMHLENIIEC